MYTSGNFVLGKEGALTSLWKKHKYAVAKELSEPLSDHIMTYRPRYLGHVTEEQLKRQQQKQNQKKNKKKAYATVKMSEQPKDLLSQIFKGDYTITVAEAARRSFVEIIYFVLYH